MSARGRAEGPSDDPNVELRRLLTRRKVDAAVRAVSDLLQTFEVQERPWHVHRLRELLRVVEELWRHAN